MVQRSENHGNGVVVNGNNGVITDPHSTGSANSNNNTSATYLYYLMSNAMKATNGVHLNHNDADSIDSGTCSEDTSPIPPPLPKKTGKSTKILLNATDTSTVVENHNSLNMNMNGRGNGVHFSDSEESESSFSSIGSGSVNGQISTSQSPRVRFSLSYLPLPDSLLKDIRATNTILRKATQNDDEKNDQLENSENENGKITINLQDLTINTSGEYQPQSILKKTNHAQFANSNNNNTSATYLYYLMSNAMKATNGVHLNHNDADSIDSGTCSEDTSPIPPPLPKKTGKSTKILLNATDTSTVVENHNSLNMNGRGNGVHFSDSEESESSFSSIGSGSVNGQISTSQSPRVRFSLSYLPLPDSLLKDIRATNTILRKATQNDDENNDQLENSENGNGKITIKLQDLTINTSGEYQPQSILKKTNHAQLYNDTMNKRHVYEDDKFYNFHINERDTTPDTEDEIEEAESVHDQSEETFAGFKEIQSGNSTIRSAKGTVRGVRNRVRNGIATFLKIQQHTTKVSFLYI
uniref:CSON008401 protein n=1 Tax=Culicoides sonorensis TaxID=179676 RepID=A0A336N1S8_CULSO